ncbi:MAG: DUF6282 family protein [Chloroflexota bacterium]
MNLAGVVDLHVHSAPDLRPRSIDDLGVARQALEHGLAGVLLKNHYVPTAGRAALARAHVPGALVFGGVALNDSVGRLNPRAVEVAAHFGGRAVWLPTVSAAGQRRAEGYDDGISLLRPDGPLHPGLRAVFEVVAAHDLLLCTGHAGAAEVMAIVPAALAAGVRRVLVQHCEHHLVNLSLDQQRELAGQGAYLERVFSQPTRDGGYRRNLDVNVVAIRAVGVSSTVLASDLGQVENPPWIEGLAAYLDGVESAGFSAGEMDIMSRKNPATLLGTI